MQYLLRTAATILVAGCLLLVSLPTMAGASAGVGAFQLADSPFSSGVLIARAIHADELPVPEQTSSSVNPQLRCPSSPPCALPNVLASQGSSTANETPIAVDPTNGKDLLSGANDYGCSTLRGFYTSSDGGKTWLRHCSRSPLSGGCGDPALGYDLNGNAYSAGIDSSDGCSTGVIGVEKSSDNGQTWQTPVVAVQPSPQGFTDKDWLQIDDNPGSPHANTIYISVTQFDKNFNTHISVTHSYDGGKTWTTVDVDTKQQAQLSLDQFSDLAVGRDGTVYVTWLRCKRAQSHCAHNQASLYFSRSSDGGSTWSTPLIMTTVKLAPATCGAYFGCLPHSGVRVSEIPAIDVDTSGGPFAGRLYTVLYNWTGAYMQVEVISSSDGGSTWSAPVPVTTGTLAWDEFFPWLTVNSGGVVGVTWLDRRTDPQHRQYDAFAAVSHDGGASFGRNVRITSTSSQPMGFMGDYTGNYWHGNILYAAWADSRTGRMQDEVGGYHIA